MYLSNIIIFARTFFLENTECKYAFHTVFKHFFLKNVFYLHLAFHYKLSFCDFLFIIINIYIFKFSNYYCNAITANITVNQH